MSMYDIARQVTDEVLGEGTYASLNANHPDPGVQMAIQNAKEHIPGTRPRPKMDTPVGLFGGICSCGWQSDGLQSRQQAMKSAEAHAAAKNPKEPDDPPR